MNIYVKTVSVDAANAMAGGSEGRLRSTESGKYLSVGDVLTASCSSDLF